MSTQKEISLYKKFMVFLNKKISLLMARRSRSKEYLAVESGISTIFLDGVLFNLALIYFIPFGIIPIIELGCVVFVSQKYIFPMLIKLFNSINLVRIGN